MLNCRLQYSHRVYPVRSSSGGCLFPCSESPPRGHIEPAGRAKDRGGCFWGYGKILATAVTYGYHSGHSDPLTVILATTPHCVQVYICRLPAYWPAIASKLPHCLHSFSVILYLGTATKTESFVSFNNPEFINSTCLRW